MSIRTSSIVIQPLRGMDDRHVVAPNRASLIRDMTWDQRDGWKVCGGIVRATPDYSTGESTANGWDSYPKIVSLFWFAQNNGATQWLVWEDASGRLRYLNGSRSPASPFSGINDIDGDLFNGSDRSRTISDVPWFGTSGAVYAGNLYLVNGIDTPIVFDGIKACRAGFPRQAPSPDVTTPDATAGGTPPRTTGLSLGVGQRGKDCGRRYKVTFVNERGQESPASETSGMVTFTNGAGYRMTPVLELPRGNSDTVARRIYATQDPLNADGEPINLGTADNYYFLDEVQDNETRLYVDLKPDGVLGSVLDEDALGAWPADGYIICVFKDTMFMWTEEGLRYSAPGQPEVWPEDNFLPCGDGGLGRGSGLFATRDALVAFRQRGTFLIGGDPATGFYARPMTTDVGCAAPRTITELPGVGLMFLSESGVHLLEGALENSGTPTAIRTLSIPISEQIDRINKTAICNACATVNRKDREAWIAVPVLGEINPSLVLCYHFEIGEWSIRTGLPISAMVTTGDTRQYVYIGSHDASRPGLWVYSHGTESKGGARVVEPIYETADLDFGSSYRGTRLYRLMARTIGYGTNDIGADVTINRQMATSLEAVVSRDQAYVQDVSPDDAGSSAFPQYGSVVVDGSALWVEHRPVTVRFDVDLTEERPIMELRVSFTWPSAQRGYIVGYELEVNPGSRREVMPFSEVFGVE